MLSFHLLLGLWSGKVLKEGEVIPVLKDMRRTLALVRCESSASRPCRLTPGGNSLQYPLTKAAWVPEPVWMIWRSEHSWPYRDLTSDPSVIQLTLLSRTTSPNSTCISRPTILWDMPSSLQYPTNIITCMDHNAHLVPYDEVSVYLFHLRHFPYSKYLAIYFASSKLEARPLNCRTVASYNAVMLDAELLHNI
jgi:hypothetical protein